jgi:hypothetical protein
MGAKQQRAHQALADQIAVLNGEIARLQAPPIVENAALTRPSFENLIVAFHFRHVLKIWGVECKK